MPWDKITVHMMNNTRGLKKMSSWYMQTPVMEKYQILSTIWVKESIILRNQELGILTMKLLSNDNICLSLKTQGRRSMWGIQHRQMDSDRIIKMVKKSWASNHHMGNIQIIITITLEKLNKLQITSKIILNSCNSSKNFKWLCWTKEQSMKTIWVEEERKIKCHLP
jgi:hypothetical protein